MKTQEKNKPNQTTIEHLFINITLINQSFDGYFSCFQNQFFKLKNDYHLAIKTIYIATSDSIFLTNNQLVKILSLIGSIIDNDLVEYSFEIGYQTLSAQELKVLKTFGVNRLVWKIRTFNNNLLQQIDEKFNVNQILSLISASLALDFNNSSFDLEYNLSGQTEVDLVNDLEFVLSWHPKHISYQSATNHHNLTNKNLITQFLDHHNYDNYECFSFALTKNNYSQHTLAYLQLKNWFGLGPNAGSFMILKDKVITSNYDHNWQKKTKILTKNQYYQLLITQGLMLKSGFSLTGTKLLAYKKYLPVINKLINDYQLEINDNFLMATNQGWILLNQVLLDIINR